MSHDGWTNYETWAVFNWLTNDQLTAQDLQHAFSAWKKSRRAEVIKDFVTSMVVVDDVDPAIAHLIRQLRHHIFVWEKDRCVEVFKNFMASMVCGDGARANLAHDLLNLALDNVNWCELAEHFSEEEAVID